jgi:hypothetical protein
VRGPSPTIQTLGKKKKEPNPSGPLVHDRFQTPTSEAESLGDSTRITWIAQAPKPFATGGDKLPKPGELRPWAWPKQAGGARTVSRPQPFRIPSQCLSTEYSTSALGSFRRCRTSRQVPGIAVVVAAGDTGTAGYTTIKA